MIVFIFVWETKQWEVKSGYCSRVEEKNIEEKLRTSEDVEWYKKFSVTGSNLTFGFDLRKIDESDVP